jgi:hypothetical protein
MLLIAALAMIWNLLGQAKADRATGDTDEQRTI